MKSKYMIFIVCSSTVSFPNYVHMLGIQDIIRNTAQHWHTLINVELAFEWKILWQLFLDIEILLVLFISDKALKPYLLAYQKNSESCSVLSDSLRPPGLHNSWNSPGQNTRVVLFLFSRGSSQPRDQTQVSRTAGGFFTSWATREAQEYWSESIQELNWGLLHCRFFVFCFFNQLSYQGSPQKNSELLTANKWVY